MKAKSLILIVILVMNIGAFGQQQQIEQLQEQVIKLQGNLSDVKIQLEESNRINKQLQEKLKCNTEETCWRNLSCKSAHSESDMSAVLVSLV